MKPNAKLTDLRLDTANLNRHTERGTYMTGKSIDKFGSRLAGILDAKNRVIDANLRTEKYAENGINDVMIIDADSNIPVYLRYNDLDLGDSDNPARELQLALHRSGIESFSIDAENLAAHLMEYESLADDWYFESELEDVLKSINLEIDFGIAGFEGDGNEDGINQNEGEQPLQPSHVRMLQIFLNTETFPKMMAMVEELHLFFDTSNTTDCVYKAVEYARDTLTRK